MRRAVYVIAALFVLTTPCIWSAAEAQTPFYREARPVGSAIIPNTNPAFERAVFDDYVAFMEWYFEMRFTPEERAQYDAYLINDWNTNPVYRNNLLVTAKEMR